MIVINSSLILLLALKKGKLYTVATWDAASDALSGLGNALC
jgi:hypothetical protein